MHLMRTIPALPVQDIAVAVDFYRDKLGFTEVHQDTGFAIVRRDSAEVHLWAARDERWQERLRAVLDGSLRVDAETTRMVVSGAESFLAGTASCRIEVEGIDDLHAEYQTKGVLYSDDTVVKAQPWGTREFPVLDLHRNLLTFFEEQD